MIRLPKMDLVTPLTVEEACLFLDERGETAKVLAGGTDLLVACKLGNIRPVFLIGLKGIKELQGINFLEGEGLRIGAMTSLYDVRNNSFILDQYQALGQAATAIGSMQLQCMGTLGGNLCLNTRCLYYNQSNSWRKCRAVCFKMGGDVCHVVPKGKKCYAVFSGDLAPVLIAFDAKVKLISRVGERVVPVSELYTADGREPIALKSNEILAEVRIPTPIGNQSSVYLKYRRRGAIDFPLAGVAARVVTNSDGICTDCKVVLNALDSAPKEVFGICELMKGKSISSELITQISQMAMEGAHPVANTSDSTPTYRRKMAGILTLRALTAVAESLGFVGA